MNRHLQFARENGWPALIARVGVGGLRRVRDAGTARRLNAPGFRAGRAPRLLGSSHIRLGQGVSFGDDLWLEAVTSYGGVAYEPRLVLGNGVGGSDRVHIACTHSVEIGEGTLIGSHVLISDHAHGVYGAEGHGPAGGSLPQSAPELAPVLRPLSSIGPVRIGRNVWLGEGVAVLAGAVIGDGAVIGAHAVVTGTVPAGTVAVGSPARPVRRWDAATGSWERINASTLQEKR